MSREARFIECGVDHLLDCINVQEITKCKSISCKICARKNLNIQCNKCYISQTAEQLITIVDK